MCPGEHLYTQAKVLSSFLQKGTSCVVQANVNEIMAASVVYIGQVPVDRPCTCWNNSRHLRHFSVLRKMDNQPFPTGNSPDSSFTVHYTPAHANASHNHLHDPSGLCFRE